MVEWLKQMGETDEEILSAILSHNYAHTGQNPPKNKLEWALYCCDELTGLIVAVALVKPDKKLASVTIDSIMKKWKQRSFAAGVKREQIEECEPRLGIPLKEFVQIALEAMQGISKDLGL
ncbi:MAG: phosphohydrolase, partial [Microgenomates group bacterium]